MNLLQHRFALPALLCSLALVFPVPGSAQTQESMSGAWNLNESDSDDVRAAVRDAMGNRGRDRGGDRGRAGGRMGGRQGGRSGGPPAGGRSGGPPGGGRPGAQMGQNGFAEDLAAPAVLVFEESADSVTITFGDADRLVLGTDGKTIELPRRGRTMKAKVKQDDGMWVLEREFEDGPKVVDRFELTSPERLLVHREFKTGRIGTLKVTFAYDRDPEG